MKTHWKLMALVLVAVMILGVPACSKKKISSEASTTSEEERKRAEEERQRELDRQKALQEEDLKEGSLSEQMARERMETERSIFENEDIYFEFDSVRLTPQGQELLQKKASWLSENKTSTVIIEGHADNRGTNEYNLALGEGRAQSAKTFLLDLGIDGSRLQTISYGEERPLDPRETEDAWAKNRRAHFVIQE